MKAKVFCFVVTVSFLAAFSSCKSDDFDFPPYEEHEFITNDVLYEKGSLLKTEYQVFSDSSKQVFAVYDYDSQGRISKVNHSGTAYDIYKYNDKGLLECITAYNEEMIQSQLPFRIVSYQYDINGNKIKEITKYNDTVKGAIYNDVVDYIYENQKLKKTVDYSKGNLISYVVYEYDDSGNVSRERRYGSNDDSFVETTHTYRDGLLVYSITRSGASFMYDSRKIYDKNGHLILKIDNMPPLSSSAHATEFLVTRMYEYI